MFKAITVDRGVFNRNLVLITSGTLYYPCQVNYSTSPTEGIVEYPIVAKSGGDLFPNTAIIPYGK